MYQGGRLGAIIAGYHVHNIKDETGRVRAIITGNFTLRQLEASASKMKSTPRSNKIRFLCDEVRSPKKRNL